MFSFDQYYRHFNHHLNLQTHGGGEGSFSIQKLILQIVDLYKGPFLDVFQKKIAISRKWGEGVKGRLECFHKFLRFGSVTCPFSPYDFSPCWPRKGFWSVVRSGKEIIIWKTRRCASCKKKINYWLTDWLTASNQDMLAHLKSESSPAQLTALRETCWKKTTSPPTLLRLNNIKKIEYSKNKNWNQRSTPHKDFGKKIPCSQGTAPWCSRVCLTSSLRLWPSSFYQLSLSFNKISFFN